MMGFCTYGNVKFAALDADMRRAILPLHEATTALTKRIDEDTDAFRTYMEAVRLPKVTDEEIATRSSAIQKVSSSLGKIPNLLTFVFILSRL
jgi:formiminotetrahydrofolate cyclodeaminase